jgi:hypothetical protein
MSCISTAILTALPCNVGTVDLTPTTLRTAGGLFELGGLALVAWGIYTLRSRFSERPSSLRAAVAFVGSIWNRLRPPRRDAVVQADAIGVTLSVGNARVKVSPSPTQSLEEKVETLIQTVDRLQDEDGRLADEIAAEQSARIKAVQSEQAAREAGITEIRESIRELATGDLTRQFWGVILFAMGVLLQVWSPEIARFL